MTEPRSKVDTNPYHLEWMNDKQKECHQFLADLVYGYHHITGIVRPMGSNGIYINSTRSNYLATYDFNGLTRAVVMAHDRCIRFEVAPSGPGMLRLNIHKRRHSENDGSLSMWEWHPTLEHHVEAIRKGDRP